MRFSASRRGDRPVREPSSIARSISRRRGSLEGRRTPSPGNRLEALEEAMRRDLAEISILDPKAPTRIAARILVNELDLGVLNGGGRMEEGDE